MALSMRIGIVDVKSLNIILDDDRINVNDDYTAVIDFDKQEIEVIYHNVYSYSLPLTAKRMVAIKDLINHIK